MKWAVLAVCIVLAALLCLIWRRRMCIRRVRRMDEEEKCCKLNELAAPFGFAYDPAQEIFVSRVDAWQRKEGYEALFDRLAVKFHMVMDAFPVYFDYCGKTWLIEFWKGQYGINTGAEVGVYHTNRIVTPVQRKLVHYNAVTDEEMPKIGICLEQKNRKLFSLKQRHWWLAAFRMGLFGQPKDLILYASISFHDEKAAQAFCKGLTEAGFTNRDYRIRGRSVSVLLDRTIHYTGLKRFHRAYVQCVNRFCCGLYRIVTRPFTNTADRMLFLYELLPWCFRRMLCLHAFGTKIRIKK